MSTSADLSSHFADFVVNTKYSDLPADAIDGAKKSILDTLAVMIAATGVEPAVRGVADLVRDMGGKPESSILGFGGRAPALMAAFANGAMAHCLDFDDHAPEGHHPSSSIVPAVFALAERRGGVSGRELITAVAIGQDLFMRLRRNVESRQDWHLTTVLGVFSATAAAARVLGLDRERVVSALGIAFLQSSGTLELAYGVGSDLRGLYAGFTTKAAVLAALMAERGISGTKSAFEGKAGFFGTYFGGKYGRAKMLEGLGQNFSGGAILYKPWPSCGVSHGFIHATIELMKAHRLTIADIHELRVHVGDFQLKMCEPIEGRRKPATSADAKFSVPFCVAIAATHGKVGVADFFGAGLKNPQVLAAAQKVVPVVDDSQDWTFTIPKGRLDIITRDGRTLTHSGGVVPGDVESPMSWEFLLAKFDECVALAAVPPSPAKAAQARQMLCELETLDDAGAVMRALT